MSIGGPRRSKLTVSTFCLYDSSGPPPLSSPRFIPTLGYKVGLTVTWLHLLGSKHKVGTSFFPAEPAASTATSVAVLPLPPPSLAALARAVLGGEGAASVLLQLLCIFIYIFLSLSIPVFVSHHPLLPFFSLNSNSLAISFVYCRSFGECLTFCRHPSVPILLFETSHTFRGLMIS